MRWKLVILALALVLAIQIRTVNLNEPYINSFDPLIMWRHADRIVEEGYLPAEDTMRYQPFGWNSREVLPMSAYSIANLCAGDCDVKFLTKWQPVVYGVLAIGVMAFIGLKVWGTPTLPVIFLGLLPGFVLRTAEGFGEKEPIASLLIAISMYFFYRSQDERPIFHGAFAGIALGMATLSWGGYLLFLLAFVSYIAVKTVFGKLDRKVLAVLPMFALTATMAMSIPATSEFFARFDIKIATTISVFSVLTYFVNLKLESRWKSIGVALVSLFVIGTALGFNIPSMATNAWHEFLFPIRGGVSGTSHQFSVGEQAATSVAWPWDGANWKNENQIWQQTGSLLFLGMLSIFIALKTKRDEDLLTFVIFAFLFHGASTIVRLIFPFMMGLALAATCVFAWWFSVNKKSNLGKYVGLGVLVVLVFGITQKSFALAPSVMAASGGDSEWFENLKWINLNTPPREPVVSWWDYGYLIQQIAKRPSVGDGGNVGPKAGPNGDLNWYTGHFFVNSDTDESVTWLLENNFNTVTMDSSMIGKFYWVSTLGGNSTYYTIFTKTEDKQVTLPDGTVAMAGMFSSPSGEHLVAVYSENGTIPILSVKQGQGVVDHLIQPTGIKPTYKPEGLPVAAGGVYLGGNFAMYAPPVAENSLFTKLYFMFGKDTPFTLGFWNSYTKTYLLDPYKAARV